MSAVIDPEWIASWFDWLTERSLVGAAATTVVVAVLAVLRLFPRRFVSAHLPSRLLLIPFLFLVVPVEKCLPPSVLGGLLPEHAERAPAESGGVGLRGDLGTDPSAEPSASVVPPLHVRGAGRGESARPAKSVVTGTPPTMSLPTLALGIWITAFLIGLRSFWRDHRATRRELTRRECPVPLALATRFAGLARAGGVRGVALCVARGIASPLVCGTLRPTVYVPADLVDELTPQQLDFALRHEIEHVRRCDPLAESLVGVVRLMFWFHPGVWLCSALLGRWREFACDEAALARTEGASSDVAETLLSLVERACEPALRAPASAHLFTSRHFMKTRLTRILDHHQAASPRLSWAGSLALGLVTTLTLTVARAQDEAGAPFPDAGSDVTEVLEQGARWLVANQQRDGSWGVGKDPSGKNHRDHNEVCITAMVVRALLPYLDKKELRLQRPVLRAITFLEQSQAENGRFGPHDGMTMMYAHANALRALCAVQAVVPHDDRLRRIEKGVAYALRARNPYRGWRYMPRGGDNDSKITAVMLLALHEAAAVGVESPSTAFEGGLVVLDELTDTNSGRTGFTRPGETMSRFVSKKARYPGKYSEEPTAMYLLVRRALEPDSMPGLRTSAEVVATRLPEWSREKGSIDLAYWEFGAAAMAAQGGDPAKRWRKRLHEALLPNRIVEGDQAHWPAIDAWSHVGMEAYTTASAMLALSALR